MNRLDVAAVAAALVLAGGAAVRAEPYQGVVPGTGNDPPKAGVVKAGGARLMTWPGFQMLPGGRSRVFVQTSAVPQFETRAAPDRFVLLLKKTRLHLRNNRRPLETRFFDTPVARVQVKRQGKNLAIVVSLRAPVSPEVRVEKAPDKDFYFVLMDFPPSREGSSTGQ